MKIRSGFVSNSSSSSFLLIGFKGGAPLRDIVDKFGLNDVNEDQDWEERDKLLTNAGFHDYGYGTKRSGNGVVIVEGYSGIECVGIEAENELNAGKTVQEVGSVLVDKLYELNEDLEISSDDTRICFGTSSSEW
ncbi:MAG: hypothetical protein ACXAC5_05255 [Promethearchaeota archaeon]|jgi:hypothetical protein